MFYKNAGEIKMKIELLVYAYLFVCLAMIGFNIVCIFLFSHNDKEVEQSSLLYIDLIKNQFGKEAPDDEHRQLLLKRLVHVRELTAFDKSLEILSEEFPEEIQAYLSKLDSVFITLADRYNHKDELQMAYFPYIIARYRLFYGEDLLQINRILFDLLAKPSVYCRENALNAFYFIGIGKNVAQALKTVDESGYYHNKKLLTDGLISFSGDKNELNAILWERLWDYSLNIQLAILDYIRFSSGDYQEKMLALLKEEHNCEIHFCAIRYLGRYPYEPAYEQLMKYAEHEDEMHWEYTSITCFALASYPSDRTIDVLKKNLSSHNWYVRLNASQALENLKLEYADFIDIFEGDDRYASEMMRYRFDRKKLSERSAAKI